MNEIECDAAIERLEAEYGPRLLSALESGDIGGFINTCNNIYVKMRGRVAVQEMMTMNMINMGNPATCKTVTDFINETQSLEWLIPQSMRDEIRKELLEMRR